MSWIARGLPKIAISVFGVGIIPVNTRYSFGTVTRYYDIHSPLGGVFNSDKLVHRLSDMGNYFSV
jgi:hypothetical protein